MCIDLFLLLLRFGLLLAFSIPNFNLKLRVQPITNTIMKVILTLTAEFQWSDRYHGLSEPFR